jgi:hypothetical protein
VPIATGVGIDLYAYVTLTGPSLDGVGEAVVRFAERLARLDPALPSRTVPLRIEEFGPTAERVARRDVGDAMMVQEAAIGAWRSAVGNSVAAR